MPLNTNNHSSLILRNFLFLLHISYFIFSAHIHSLLESSSVLTFYLNNFSISLTSLYFFSMPIFYETSIYDHYYQVFNFWDKLEYFIRFVCLVVNMFDIIIYSNFYLILWNMYLYTYITVKYFINFPGRNKKINIKIPGQHVNSTGICFICYENKLDWKLPCNHSCHKICLEKWFTINSSCPICRKKYLTI